MQVVASNMITLIIPRQPKRNTLVTCLFLDIFNHKHKVIHSSKYKTAFIETKISDHLIR